MSHPAGPKTLEELNKFVLERVINEDPITHSLSLLGTFPSPDSTDAQSRVPAIIRIEKTALDVTAAPLLFSPDGSGLVQRAQLEGSTDIYGWLFGWLGEGRESDLKINVICPATDVHIRKYSRQQLVMVNETPELYEKVVKPYIAAFPSSRTQWVENILNGISEQNKLLYSSSEFIILPDMKWDLKTLSSLYLVAIAQDRTIRSLRDLRKPHVPMLQRIRDAAAHIVQEKYGLGNGSLRSYIHYQPSYYHFHVHIVNANHVGFMGMNVGQAHLLDDVISLLELELDDGPSIYERITLTYSLGDQHGLNDLMVKTSNDPVYKYKAYSNIVVLSHHSHQ